MFDLAFELHGFTALKRVWVASDTVRNIKILAGADQIHSLVKSDYLETVRPRASSHTMIT